MSKENACERVVDGKVWSDFCDRLKQAGTKIVEASPESAFDRAEGLRYLGRLTQHFLRSALEESDPAQAILSSVTPKIGLDNPDYAYAGARLSDAFEYRLMGRVRDAATIGFGTFSGALGTPRGLIRDAYLTLEELEVDATGRFEIAISREERPGNWLAMTEKTNSLSIRQTLLHRASETPAELELIRVDAGEAPAPLSPEALERGLDRAALMIGGVVAQFLGWTRSFMAHEHEIRPIDPKLAAFAQGDPNTQYLYGYWELARDEAFVIDLEPPECDYWNLQIGNHWLESLDFMHHTTHINQATAIAREDGRVRAIVARSDPGLPNWLDPAGHERGTLALRWVGAEAEVPLPRTRVLKLDALASGEVREEHA
jgi:hypothetical protein